MHYQWIYKKAYHVPSYNNVKSNNNSKNTNGKNLVVMYHKGYSANLWDDRIHEDECTSKAIMSMAIIIEGKEIGLSEKQWDDSNIRSTAKEEILEMLGKSTVGW